MRKAIALALVAGFLVSGCATPCRRQPKAGPCGRAEGKVFYGKASYYAKKYHGRQTASGEIFNMYDMTAAHKTLGFGTDVRVTNLENKKSVVVRINDRGPFVAGRVIDLSYAAAKKLDMINAGVIEVKCEILE